MRLRAYLSSAVLGLCTLSCATAASWGFDDGSVSIHGKKAGVGAGAKEKLVERKSLVKPITLGASDTVKVLVTIKEDKKAKRPHQAFLRLEEKHSRLETSYAFAVKESGKGKVEIARKDIPAQLLASKDPLSASIIIGSFGTTKAYYSHAFDLALEENAESAVPPAEKPLRYGKLQEIHHKFRSDPTSPPKIISLIFTAAVLFALPILVATWLSLGANLNQFSKAFGSSPVPHSIFLTSVIGMEVVFFFYYKSWNLFQTLPVAVGIGLVTFLSGSRALREVQERRLAGLR